MQGRVVSTTAWNGSLIVVTEFGYVYQIILNETSGTFECNLILRMGE